MPEARPADPLSILSLATGIGGLLFAVFSVIPLAGMCLMPLSTLCALTALVSGIASIIRTTITPGLDGRLQAIAGVVMSLVWGLSVTLLALFVARAH